MANISDARFTKELIIFDSILYCMPCVSGGRLHNRRIQLEKGNCEKIAILPPCVRLCYLFNRMHFHFHLCVTGIPADLHMLHSMHCPWQADSINRPGDHDRWPFDLKIGSLFTRLMCFHPANSGLHDRYVLELGRGTRQTDIMSPPYGGRGHKTVQCIGA